MSAFLQAFGALTAVFLCVAAAERIPLVQFRPQPFARPWFATDLP